MNVVKSTISFEECELDAQMTSVLSVDVYSLFPRLQFNTLC